MQVTSTQTYLFMKEGEENFLLHNSEKGEVVTAPDWIRETKLFELAESDGSLKEMSVKSPAPTVSKTDSKSDVGLK